MSQPEPIPPPPTEHTLRPHHVGLLTLFILTFKEYEGKLPPTFLLHIYRVLLNEVVEVSPPKAYKELLLELQAGPKSEEDYAKQLIESFEACHAGLSSAEEMTNFFAGLPSLFMDKVEGEEDILPTLMRRSTFGYFCRRCFVSFLKLSFYGVGKLQQEYDAWCRGIAVPTSELPTFKDQLHSLSLIASDTHIFRTVADKTVWAQPDAYEAWDKALATGDESIATENLRRYFEQHFHENNDSGFRQHALLNLVRMHYLRQEHVAARKLLVEAIGVARTSNDTVTLQHCISMLHRLPLTIERRRPMLNEIQQHLHPLEVLFDVSKLMDEENGQPLSASFAKIVQGMGLYDQWFEKEGPSDSEQWAQHAVQSVVWSAAGCDRLSILEENLVIAFTDVGGEDNNRLTVILNQAYREARQGKYEKSLCALLQPSVWRGLTLVDYNLWAHEVWHILVLRATRRGQDRAYREILLPRRPPGEFKPRLYSLTQEGSKVSKIHDPLWDFIQMQQCDQATSAIDGLLTSLWHSEFLGRLNLYRTGIILLADVGLEYGMSKRSRRILEEIMPQIIPGQDLEQRALACFTLARCIIVAGESTADALREAVPYLLKSEQDYLALEMHRAVMDVQYFLSVVYHNLGLQAERDEVAKRHFATLEMRKQVEMSDEGITRVLEVVRMVGATLAHRSDRV